MTTYVTTGTTGATGATSAPPVATSSPAADAAATTVAPRCARAVVSALAVVGAVWVGRLVVVPQTGLGLFAPSMGVAAVWLLGSRSRTELALDTAALLLTVLGIEVADHVPVLPAALLAAGHAAAGLTVRAWFMRGLRFVPQRYPSLRSARKVLALVSGVGLAALASAPWGLIASELITGQLVEATPLTLLVRSSCGLLLVVAAAAGVAEAFGPYRYAPTGSVHTPLVWSPRRHAALELVLLELASAVVVAGVCWPWPGHPPVTFLLTPSVVLVAFRFRAWVSAANTVVWAALTAGCTIAGWGPFARTTGAPWGLLEQACVLSLAMVALFVAASCAEREALARDLAGARDEALARALLLDTVVDGMTEALMVVDAAGEVVLTNRAAALLEVTRPQVGEPLGRALRGERVTDAEVVQHDDHGTETALRLSAVPVDLPGDGGPRRVAVVSAHDVTAERRQMHDLRSFAEVAAHDMRSPLTGMLGWVEFLSEHVSTHEGDPFVVETLARVSAGGRRLRDLIDDLLAYATAGSAALDPRVLDLDEVVAEVCAQVGLARHHDPSDCLREGHEPGSHPGGLVHHESLDRVQADPVLLRQVLANLLGNAVKYVAEGTAPRIAVRSEVTAAGRVQVEVEDNGIGIPPEHRAGVFADFYRVPGHRAAYTGTGLGLAICARAVQRHDGRIHAGGRVDGATGTRVVFTLPAPPAQAA